MVKPYGKCQAPPSLAHLFSIHIYGHVKAHEGFTKNECASAFHPAWPDFNNALAQSGFTLRLKPFRKYCSIFCIHPHHVTQNK
jgi:hypothetical protein